MGDFAKYRKFQAVTILCALGFLGIKSFEYKDKFTHYEVWMNDGRRVTGHLEGNPWFFTLDKAKKRNMESVTLIPDAHHYAEKWEGHKQFQAEEKAEHAAGAHHLPPVKIATADIKRLTAFVPGHSTYFGIYFTLTALHALHVLGGALVIAFLWGPGAKMWKTEPERYTNRVEVSGLFWHFVDLVWIFLFPVLYLL
jgi:cytochrome c oxidase subunit 3